MRGTTTGERGLACTGRSARHASRELLNSYHRTGDLSARERLVELHLPLVRALALRYTNRGERFEDLVQVGAIGLLEAIDRFDPERGTDLANFAVPTISGVIRRHLRDRSAIVRMPRPLAEQARLPVCLSLAEGESAETDEALSVDGAFAASEERLLLAAGFRALAARERRILHLHFYAGLSQAEVGREIGLSQIQVSRLIRVSLARMRAALELARDTPAESLVRS